MEKREIRNVVEARLFCLELAVQSARLLGRADNVEQIADQYFAWATKSVDLAGPTKKTPDDIKVGQGSEDDAGPVGGDKDKSGGTGAEGGQGGPASLRQAGGGKNG